MRAKLLIIAVVLVGSLAVSLTASAHHNARAMYESQSVMLQGTVVQYEWANPHSVISFNVKTDTGAVQQWHAEFLPPVEMTRAGWTRDTIKPGDMVTMTGRPGKHSQHILWLESVVMADGRKLGRSR